MEKNIHKAIKKVSEDFEAMKFNTAIATMMALVNDFYKVEKLTKADYMTLLALLNPVAPHITEELWEKFGGEGFLSLSKWPEFDPAKTVDDEIEIVVQINGKIKDKILVPADMAKEDVEKTAMEAEKAKEAIEGKTVVKVICVPGKLVNIVVK